MTKLIPLDAALTFVNSKVTNSGYSILGCRIEQGIAAIPAIDLAAIRDAALREALEAVSQAAWKHNGDDSYSAGLEDGARVQNEADRDAILALIGEKK